jgi:hypothetical protein
VEVRGKQTKKKTKVVKIGATRELEGKTKSGREKGA